MSNATTTNGKAPSQDVVAVIVGALAAMGYSADQIAHIRPIVSYNWTDMRDLISEIGRAHV